MKVCRNICDVNERLYVILMKLSDSYERIIHEIKLYMSHINYILLCCC